MPVDAGFLSERVAIVVDMVKRISHSIFSSFLISYFLHFSSFIVPYAPAFCTNMHVG
jgi:hypothetical protein